MSFAEYQSIAYGRQLKEAKNENLFRSIWVQLNNVNVSKKSDLIKNPEKYWGIPLLDIKEIKIPTEQEKANAYELGKKWQNINFTEEVQFDSLNNIK
jgi:hypothetical protein